MKEPPRQYASAAALRVALETRLNAISTTEGIDLQRLRRQVSFYRLLARFFAEKNAPWLLKGGYAMERRLRTARTSKDIDISLPAEMVDAFDGGVVKRVQQGATRAGQAGRSYRPLHESWWSARRETGP